MREARPPEAGKLLASPAVAGQTCLPAGRDKKFQFASKNLS